MKKDAQKEIFKDSLLEDLGLGSSYETSQWWLDLVNHLIDTCGWERPDLREGEEDSY